MSPRATTKIVNPDWPTDYIVIAAEDFDPARHQRWPEDQVASPRPSGEANAEAPPAPDPAAVRSERAAAMAKQRVVDVGQEIAQEADAELLEELARVDARKEVRRLIAVRLEELRRPPAAREG